MLAHRVRAGVSSPQFSQSVCRNLCSTAPTTVPHLVLPLSTAIMREQQCAPSFWSVADGSRPGFGLTCAPLVLNACVSWGRGSSNLAPYCAQHRTVPSHHTVPYPAPHRAWHCTQHRTVPAPHRTVPGTLPSPALTYIITSAIPYLAPVLSHN